MKDSFTCGAGRREVSITDSLLLLLSRPNRVVGGRAIRGSTGAVCWIFPRDDRVSGEDEFEVAL